MNWKAKLAVVALVIAIGAAALITALTVERMYECAHLSEQTGMDVQYNLSQGCEISINGRWYSTSKVTVEAK